jgi:putative aminopeptidase FrvX
MYATGATAACLLAILSAGLACKRSERASASQPPADAGTVVTVYLPSRMADRLMGRLQGIAAQHQWALSVRTDTAAMTEADLVIVDSAGSPVSRVRPGARAGRQAQQMADAIRR